TGETAADLGQARSVDRSDDVGTRREDVLELAVEDCARRLGVLDREGSPEPAAFGRARQLDKVEPPDCPQQRVRRLADMQPTEGVARRVVRDRVRKVRTDVGDAEAPDEKLGQLENSRCENVDLLCELLITELLRQVG